MTLRLKAVHMYAKIYKSIVKMSFRQAQMEITILNNDLDLNLGVHVNTKFQNNHLRRYLTDKPKCDL